jgi:acyl dehydratase
MKEHYFDDLKAGDRFKSDQFEVTEKQLIEFAYKFDPQMFHLDRKSAERTIFKGLIASGWHTAAITMRLFVRTLNFAEGAIGLGVDELRWPNAVRPGDSLQVETEIVDLRPSRSKPNYGIIRLRNVTTNQGGEIVQTMTASAMIPRRVPDKRRPDHRPPDNTTTDHGRQDNTTRKVMRDYTKDSTKEQRAKREGTARLRPRRLHLARQPDETTRPQTTRQHD